MLVSDKKKTKQNKKRSSKIIYVGCIRRPCSFSENDIGTHSGRLSKCGNRVCLKLMFICVYICIRCLYSARVLFRRGVKKKKKEEEE